MMLLSVLFVAAIGAELTFYLIHKKHVSTVRASSASSLLFALSALALQLPFGNVLPAAFFGATFVGMTDKSRLGYKRVFAASLIFGLIFTFLIPLAQGFGGGLGAAAFVSCAVVHLAGKAMIKFMSRS
ncbi:hypothetical protein D3C87_1185720 [compost metagenome]